MCFTKASNKIIQGRGEERGKECERDGDRKEWKKGRVEEGERGGRGG